MFLMWMLGCPKDKIPPPVSAPEPVPAVVGQPAPDAGGRVAELLATETCDHDAGDPPRLTCDNLRLGFTSKVNNIGYLRIVNVHDETHGELVAVTDTGADPAVDMVLTFRHVVGAAVQSPSSITFDGIGYGPGTELRVEVRASEEVLTIWQDQAEGAMSTCTP